MVRSVDSKRSSSLEVELEILVMTELPVSCGEQVRAVTQGNVAHALSVSRPCEVEGTTVDGVEDPTARSDFLRGNTAVSASGPSTGAALLLVSLRDRRPFHRAERNFRILSMDRCWISADGEAMVGGDFVRLPGALAFSRRPPVIFSIDNTGTE